MNASGQKANFKGVRRTAGLGERMWRYDSAASILDSSQGGV